MKVAELEGVVLDYWVAKAEGKTSRVQKFDGLTFCQAYYSKLDCWLLYEPSKDWAAGGPIIEREKICVGYCGDDKLQTTWPGQWYAQLYTEDKENWHQIGDKPLVAAMRCRVAIRYGHHVQDEPT